ncbi:MAG TPA: LytTR family DNA-binding domain-containing protein [Terrimicrobiaceae bacterium]
MKAKNILKRVNEEPHQDGENGDSLEITEQQNGNQAPPETFSPADEPLRNDDFVVLTDNVKCCILRMSDLLRLEAEGNYSRVYWIGSSMLIRRPLRDCEKRLDRSKFFRARRDCIVNLEHVKHTRIVDLMRYVFVLQDGSEVTLSRRQSLVLRKSRSL